jgi:hypothetical protein
MVAAGHLAEICAETSSLRVKYYLCKITQQPERMPELA